MSKKPALAAPAETNPFDVPAKVAQLQALLYAAVRAKGCNVEFHPATRSGQAFTFTTSPSRIAGAPVPVAFDELALEPGAVVDSKLAQAGF